MALSIADVRELFLQLWPPGRLYDWRNPVSKIARFVDGCAEALKTFGYDVIDRLHREISPSRCLDNIPDWEKALALSSSYTALNGTIEQRRAGIIAKLREFGAFTLPNAQAILAPLLGYADAGKLQMLEVDRDAMRAAHTYTNATPQTGTYFVASPVQVNDGGTLSSAGAQVTVQLPAVPSPLFPLTFYLLAPNGKYTSWTTTQLGQPSAQYQLYDHTLVGVPCTGTWTFYVVASSFAAPVALSSWSLFVEGVGPAGLGGDIVDWGGYADPALMGSSGVPPDLKATQTAIERIEHAHTKGYLILSMTAIPDLPTTLPDATLPG